MKKQENQIRCLSIPSKKKLVEDKPSKNNSVLKGITILVMRAMGGSRLMAEAVPGWSRQLGSMERGKELIHKVTSLLFLIITSRAEGASEIFIMIANEGVVVEILLNRWVQSWGCTGVIVTNTDTSCKREYLKITLHPFQI